MNVSVAIDTSGLTRGIAAASQYSKRTLPQIVNTSAYWVAVNARKEMPFVAAEKVDSELGVIATPVVGKRGVALKRKKTLAGKAMGRIGVPLAAMIVVARAKAGSRYNQSTNARYALPKNPFKGVSRAEGAAAMRALVDKMLKARHRSGHFLQAGWLGAIRMLRGLVNASFLQTAAESASGGNNLGTASPASEGATCQASIENLVGLEGQNAASFNQALHRYGTGPLQRAIDGEGRRQMEYALKKAELGLANAAAPSWH